MTWNFEKIVFLDEENNMIDFPADRSLLVWDEFEKPYFQSLVSELKIRKEKWEVIYPAWSNIFHAFQSTPLNEVNVVILWQDPYHGVGQAHGLSFSVPEWVTTPPSLKNIYKELISEFGWVSPSSGDLTSWTKQGVVLLNAILTVQATLPASHHGLWREQFTDTVIQKLSDQKSWLVFLLRGNFARSKKVLIDTKKHLILEAPHPSPFSAHSGFFWCGHFLKTNERLEANQKKTIQRL